MKNSDTETAVKPMTKLDTYAGSRIQQTWYRLRDLDTGHTPVALYKAHLQRSLEDIEEALKHLDAKSEEIAAGQEQLMWERIFGSFGYGWERIARTNEAEDA